MSKITCEQIKSFLSLVKIQKEIGMTKDYSDMLVNFIKDYKNKVKDKSDIIWIFLHEDFFSKKDLRLFAVWCGREAMKKIKTPNKSSIEAINVAERYANGEATIKELITAWDNVVLDNDSIFISWAARDAAAMSDSTAAAWAATWYMAAGDYDTVIDKQIDKLIEIIKTYKREKQ